MNDTTDLSADFERRSAELWAAIDTIDDEAVFFARIDELVAELPADHPVALFERACAQDSHGHSDVAVPLYRRALELGLAHGERRRRAIVQMSSSLRNTGHAAEAVELLRAERAKGSDHLDDAISCTLALCLADSGREREAVSVALLALTKYLPRYQRSMTNYARALVEPDLM